MERKFSRIAAIIFTTSVLIGVVGSAKPSIRISADQEAITRGQSTTLRWTSNNADRVTISDLGTVPSSGSRVVSPSQSTTYNASATGPGGTDNASARVTVTDEIPLGD